MRRLFSTIAVIGVILILFFAINYFTKKPLEGEETFSAKSIANIDLNSDVATISILPTNSNDIKVIWEGKSKMFGKTEVDIEQDSETLHIDIGRIKIFNFLQFGFNFNSLDVDVFLPEKLYDSINLRNNVGSTLISGIKTDELTVHTDVSDMTIEGVHANDIKAESAVGDIVLKNSHGIVDVKNDVGDITIVTEAITDDMELITNVGGVSIVLEEIPSDTSFNANTEVGTVTVFGERGSYVLKQSDYLVTINTDVGDINVEVN
ncbi:hypothetical protein CIL05_02360 [Virgibacillus profundi]|uniref:DUF4097 domain-containing protein n=1 Tax=Virgibacillus profundi TaxID=2024555 RepID=A0A2A2IK44_9BACI|nr:DUF4097 family beta strand repeat-containing protein [Virgibacillus profundi]PAV31520.1 hypothetical protein CIL05_02360 [Virgibacillus profundi]PXY55706.1 hypothetical protein CIT14_02370 [Virgibacillus profundi]